MPVSLTPLRRHCWSALKHASHPTQVLVVVDVEDVRKAEELLNKITMYMGYNNIFFHGMVYSSMFVNCHHNINYKLVSHIILCA